MISQCQSKDFLIFTVHLKSREEEEEEEAINAKLHSLDCGVHSREGWWVAMQQDLG